MDKRKFAGLMAGAILVLAACSSTPSAGTGAKGPDGALVKRADIKIEVVTHGQAIDGFWGVVRNGVKAAASDMGVTVNRMR
jgi:ABC-type sugar transport system substrate-binding protein